MSAHYLVKCRACDKAELAKHLLKTQTLVLSLLMWRLCLPFTYADAKYA